MSRIDNRTMEQRQADALRFKRLLTQLGGTEDRKGEVHVTCPNCGKQPKKGQVHFSFSEGGGYCMVCKERYSLKALELAVGLGGYVANAVWQDDGRKRSRPRGPRSWQRDPEATLAPYLEAPDRISAWQAYKPVTLETIHRWRLGVGALPSVLCTCRRLIVPVVNGGKIVGFRGRRIGATACAAESCAKWLTCGGHTATLFNRDALVPGKVSYVAIVGNMVDVMLLHQELHVQRPGRDERMQRMVAVCSTAGEGYWTSEWSEAVRACRPIEVRLMLDNDWPGGLPSPHVREHMMQEWRAKHPGAKIPVGSGDRVLAQLAQDKLPVVPWDWRVIDEGTLDYMKWDVGRLLQILITPGQMRGQALAAD